MRTVLKKLLARGISYIRSLRYRVESHAILKYLHVTRHVEDYWYLADPLKRAIVDRFLH